MAYQVQYTTQYEYTSKPGMLRSIPVRWNKKCVCEHVSCYRRYRRACITYVRGVYFSLGRSALVRSFPGCQYSRNQHRLRVQEFPPTLRLVAAHCCDKSRTVGEKGEVEVFGYATYTNGSFKANRQREEFGAALLLLLPSYRCCTAIIPLLHCHCYCIPLLLLVE